MDGFRRLFSFPKSFEVVTLDWGTAKSVVSRNDQLLLVGNGGTPSKGLAVSGTKDTDTTFIYVHRSYQKPATTIDICTHTHTHTHLHTLSTCNFNASHDLTNKNMFVDKIPSGKLT